MDELAAFLVVTDALPDPDHIDFKYGFDESILMKMLVDYVAARANMASFEQHVTEFPEEFIGQVALASVRVREKPLGERGPRRQDRCYYHEHEDGEVKRDVSHRSRYFQEGHGGRRGKGEALLVCVGVVQRGGRRKV